MTEFDTLDDQHTMDEGGHDGRLLAQRYRISRKLGEGGMGMVYLAEDTELGDEKVAIKFIPPMLAGNARAIRNLKKEAVTSRQLSHPNIVRLHDLHTDGHQKFLVMEYIEGATLDDVLAQRESERLPVAEVLQMVEQLAAGLDYAHSKQVLHRDLKPSNIMVGREGTVKLLDFGIAREIKDSYTRVTGNLTSGTLPYMSPEQLMGEKPTVVMDVYSLGAVVYECLSGHPPFFMGDIRRQIEVKTPALIESVPDHVNQVLQQVLSKDSAQRPQSAGALVALLKRQGDQRVAATRQPAEAEVPRPPGPVAQRAVTSTESAADSRSVAGPDSQQPKASTVAPVASPIAVEQTPAVKGAAPPAKLKSLAGVWPVMVNALIWCIGMGICVALWISLDREGWQDIEIATLVFGLVGLWGGAAIGLALRLMGLTRRTRNTITLALTWGVGWSGAAWAAVYMADEWDTAGPVLLLLALVFVASVALPLRLMRREGLCLTVRRRLSLGLGWLVALVIYGAITGGVGSFFDGEMHMREREAYPLSSALGGLVLGAVSVLVLRAVSKGAERKWRAATDQVTPSPEAHRPDDPTPTPGGQISILPWPLVQSALMWCLGMSVGLALIYNLDSETSLKDEEIAVLVFGLWGLWNGMAIGLTLKRMGLLRGLGGAISLSLGWGAVWPLGTLGGVYAAEELDSVAGVLGAITMAYGLSMGLLFLVLRRHGIRLSILRRILLGLGGLLGGFAFMLCTGMIGGLFLHEEMRLDEEIALPLGAAVGGLMLGSWIVFLMKIIVKGARPKAGGVYERQSAEGISV